MHVCYFQVHRMSVWADKGKPKAMTVGLVSKLLLFWKKSLVSVQLEVKNDSRHFHVGGAEVDRQPFLK